jgi:hypothetical protein
MKNTKIRTGLNRNLQIHSSFSYNLINFSFSENDNSFLPKGNFRPAVIKDTDNTIGLPDELLEDQLILSAQKRNKEIPLEDVSAGDDPSEINEIALESRNLSGRSMRGHGIARVEAKSKSFPHGYDKI